MSVSSPPSGPIYSTRFKIVAAVILTIAGALAVIAYLVATDESGDSGAGTGSGGTSEFVEDLIPQENTQVVQQSTIGIDLATGWQGVLRLSGQEIPADQLVVSQALNQITFTPGPGKVVQSLSPGRLCAQALVWRSAAGRDNSERTVSWCFQVV